MHFFPPPSKSSIYLTFIMDVSIQILYSIGKTYLYLDFVKFTIEKVDSHTQFVLNILSLPITEVNVSFFNLNFKLTKIKNPNYLSHTSFISEALCIWSCWPISSRLALWLLAVELNICVSFVFIHQLCLPICY